MKRNVWMTLLLLFSAVVGMALVAYSTSLGPGVGGDATIYITSARNLLGGRGLGLIEADGSFRLLPYFPPGYPLALSLLGLSGLDLVPLSRWLNVLLFGGLVILSGKILFSATSKHSVAFLGSLLFALSPVLVPVSSWAMSEPLALLLGFGSLWFVVKALKQGEITAALVLSGLLSGLAILTRYNAAAFGITGGLFLLFSGKLPRLKRLLRSALFAVLSLLPVGIWLWVDLHLTASVSSRRIELPVNLGNALLDFWKDFQNSLQFWLLPDSWVYTPRLPAVLMNLLVPAGLAAILVWYLVWVARFTKRGDEKAEARTWIPLLAVFSLVFLVVTVLVKFTTYPPITINVRMLSPMHVSLLLLVLLLLEASGSAFKKARWGNTAIAIILSLGVLWYGWITLHIVPQYHRLGLGYLSVNWQQSDTLKAIEKIPADMALVTNQEMLVLFWTGRAAYPLKEIYAAKPSVEYYRYGDGWDMKDSGQVLFKEGEAALILFDTISDQVWELYRDDTPEWVKMLTNGLFVVYDGNDGGIYLYNEP